MEFCAAVAKEATNAASIPHLSAVNSGRVALLPSIKQRSGVVCPCSLLGSAPECPLIPRGYLRSDQGRSQVLGPAGQVWSAIPYQTMPPLPALNHLCCVAALVDHPRLLESASYSLGSIGLLRLVFSPCSSSSPKASTVREGACDSQPGKRIRMLGFKHNAPCRV